MKNPAAILSALTVLGLTLGVSSPLPAEDNTTRTAAYQGSMAQDQLRAQTRRLKTEINQMLEDFSKNPAAAEEVALARTALAKLDSLSEKDMLAVVQTMREASRAEGSGEAKTKLVAASNGQKQVQAALRALSDKMTLAKDESSVQQRLSELLLRQLANQRQAKNLTDGTVRDFEVKTFLPIAVSGQEAMKTEITLLMETLKKLAANPASTNRLTFASILMVGQSSQAESLAAAAAADVAAKNYTGAIDNEGKVVAGLQSMVEALNKTKTAEERMRAAAAKIKELASLEQQLAKNTVKAEIYAMDKIKEKQQQIADEVTAIDKEISQISPQAKAPLTEAEKDLDAITDTIKAPSFRKNEANKAGVVEAQKGAADKLGRLGDMLQKKADELAGLDNPAGSDSFGAGGDSPDSKAMEAISNAANEVIKAQANISLAKGLMSKPSAADDAKSQMGKGQEALSKAQEALAGAGDAVAPSVGENLTGAKADVAATEAQTGKGAGQEKAAFGLDSAGKKAAAALKGLQDAANTLAAKGGAGPGAGKGQAGKGKPGKGPPGKSGKFDGTVASGAGSPGNTQQEDTDFSSQNKLSDKDRMALSLLQREKSPPEYTVMVQQYLINLADGEMAGE